MGLWEIDFLEYQDPKGLIADQRNLMGIAPTYSPREEDIEIEKHMQSIRISNANIRLLKARKELAAAEQELKNLEKPSPNERTPPTH